MNRVEGAEIHEIERFGEGEIGSSKTGVHADLDRSEEDILVDCTCDSVCGGLEDG